MDGQPGMVLAVAAVFVVAFVLCARAFARREGYYSTVTVFGVGCFLYYLAIPVEMALTGSDRLPALGTEMPSSMQFQIALLGTIAFLAFVAGYRCSRFSPVATTGSARECQQVAMAGTKVPTSLLAFGAASAALVLVLFPTEIRAALTSYQAAYGVKYENAVFSLLSGYAVMSLAIVAAVLLCGSRPQGLPAVLCVALVAAWGLLTFDKDPLLLAALAIAACFRGERSRRPWVLAAMLGTVGLLLPAVLVFSIWRGGGTVSSFEDLGFAIRRLDPAGPMVSLATTLNEPGAQAWGGTWLQGFYLWIPKAIWPGRPLDLSESFAQAKMAGWMPGQGMGYSLLAEAWCNFGWAGAAIQYFLIGFLWGKLWEATAKCLRSAGGTYVTGLYYVVGFYVLVLMHRGPIAGSVKSLLQMLVPLAAAHVLLDRPRSPVVASVGTGQDATARDQL